MKKNLKIAIGMTVISLSALTISGCGGVNPEATDTAIEITIEESTVMETEAKPETGASTKPASEATNASYLKTYFNVELKVDALDAESFSRSLQQVTGDSVPEIKGELNWMTAIDAAVASANFTELALSYPEDKVQNRLAFYNVKMEAEPASMANMAVALDTGLIDSDTASKAASGETFTAADAEALLMAVANANGDARNYLGLSSDPDIYGKLDQMWNSFLLFDDPILSEIGKNVVLQEIATGYGLKSAAYEARFMPELTLQYGHDNIKHAHQLIGLLASEDIEVKVQLEPKISVYQYLLEWGPISEPTPTYEIKQFDDLYLVYAVEYDLQLEFNSFADMERFNQVILEYAKKNEGNEDAIGLIYNSWWQPLYSTTRTEMSDGYERMFDCVVENGIYSIHPFALPENKDAVLEALTEMAGDEAVVTPVERFCNTAFYHYLSGADYQ